MKHPIVGQEELQTLLVREINRGQMPHAILFNGSIGYGALALAVNYARNLLCPNAHDNAGEYCGACPSCKMTGDFVHPDLHFVFPILHTANDISDDSIKIWRKRMQDGLYFDFSDWSEMLKAKGNTQPCIYAKESDSIQRKMNLKPAISDHKVMIVCWPEKMTAECANKLLKLIEEPPANSHFLFVSDAPHLILSTLYSRMQRIDVKPLTADSIAGYLESELHISGSEASHIAGRAGGNLTKAIKMARNDDEKTAGYLEQFITLMRASWRRDMKSIRQWSLNLSDWKRDSQLEFVDYCLQLVRENFIYNFHINSLISMTKSEEDFAVRFAPFVNERNILSLAETLETCHRDLSRQGNPKIIFFDMALQISVLIRK